MKLSFLYALTLFLLFSVPLYSTSSTALEQEYFKQAETYKETGDMESAAIYYYKVLGLNPTHMQSLFYIGNILFNQDKTEEAIIYYERAHSCKPESLSILFNLASAYRKIKHYQECLNCLQKILTLQPNNPRALRLMGITFYELKQIPEALLYLEQAKNLEPTQAEIMYYIGLCFAHSDKFQDAVEFYRQAVSLEPNNATFLLELANTLNMCNATEEALGLYRTLHSMIPSSKPVKYNIAYTLKKLGRMQEALPIYEQLIKENPEYAAAHFGLSLTYLSLGNFKDGWPEYEWRWKAYNEEPKKFNAPVWDGSPLTGKKILVYAEQGLGDTFQFIRYLKLLKNQGAYVIFEPQRPLVTILGLCPYIDEVVLNGRTVQSYDFCIALMSLPLIFKSDETTIPHEVPYLYADPKLTALWKEQLLHDKNFKIGICWQGNANYSTQFLRQTVAAKSMRAHMFEAIARIPGVSLYSLQKMNGDEQLAQLENKFIIYNFGNDLDGEHGRFMDTAAIIKNLDLVISIDTSICHFAAALGAPVWNLLPCPADWRWMLQRTDTPWYTNMRLFRQPKPGDWESVMEEVAQAVQELLQNPDIPNAGQLLDDIIVAALSSDTDAAISAQTLDNIIERFKQIIKYQNTSQESALAAVIHTLINTNKALFKARNSLANAVSSAKNDTSLIPLAHKISELSHAKEHLKYKISALCV